MRLINVDSYEVKEFLGDGVPEYAVLSHTWGREEVSLQDMQDLGSARCKKGFIKIQHCCRQAKADGWQWAWIDTCCIDKTSSAELSEAINSMYRWYSNSMACYAYLSDAEINSTDEFSSLLSSPRHSQQLPRWFYRGWTLQELVAPFDVAFYASDWLYIGSKRALKDPLSEATGVPAPILVHSRSLFTIPVASRMRWASKRFTTREEDLAYCLLGLFNVNMPLLYGEGPKAFVRLQQEILKVTNDHTMFLWGLLPEAEYQTAIALANGVRTTGMVAQNPRDFRKVHDATPIESSSFTGTAEITARGLIIDLHMTKLQEGEVPTLDKSLPDSVRAATYIAALNCTSPAFTARAGIEPPHATMALHKKPAAESSAATATFSRIPLKTPPVPQDLAESWTLTRCHINTEVTRQDYFENNLRLLNKDVLKFFQFERFPVAAMPMFSQGFGKSDGQFYIHRARLLDNPKSPPITLVFGVKHGMVLCEVIQDRNPDHLWSIHAAYRRRDRRGRVDWTNTFGRLGPVAECRDEVHGMRVLLRISCRKARGSDLGRYGSHASDLDLVVYTPWLGLDALLPGGTTLA